MLTTKTMSYKLMKNKIIVLVKSDNKITEVMNNVPFING